MNPRLLLPMAALLLSTPLYALRSGDDAAEMRPMTSAETDECGFAQPLAERSAPVRRSYSARASVVLPMSMANPTPSRLRAEPDAAAPSSSTGDAPDARRVGQFQALGQREQSPAHFGFDSAISHYDFANLRSSSRVEVKIIVGLPAGLT